MSSVESLLSLGRAATLLKGAVLHGSSAVGLTLPVPIQED